jgi:hypothetical protein
MATQAGVSAERFSIVSRDQIRAMLLQLSLYIKDIQCLKKSGTPGAGAMPGLCPIPNVTGMPVPDISSAPAETTTHEVKPARILMDITPEGFPIVPDLSFEKYKKEELEELMRSYLNKHYGTGFAVSEYLGLTLA